MTEAGSPRGRSRWPMAVVAAAVVAVAVLVVALVTSEGDTSAGPPNGSATTTPSDPPNPTAGDWQWLSYRDVEVRAPAAWAYAYEASRPDCIDDPADPNDPWARDVPRAPYVTVGIPNRAVPAIGCLREPKAGDPGRAFGEVPFALWQPYVKLDVARTDLPDRKDGSWEYHGWHLTRATIGDVQLSVLAPPDDPRLADTVTSSARHVTTTALGCETESAVQAERFIVPSGPAVPATRDVGAVAICAYGRGAGHPGLEGSRRLAGEAARSLVAAILSAPTGGGPDQPSSCLHDMVGDSVIALRFFGNGQETKVPLAEAYVYYDWCFGNGIVDSKHRYRLTRADCAPLFAAPPIGFWGGSARTYAACADSPAVE